MEKNKNILVGFSRFHSNKSNKDFCVAKVMRSFTSREIQGGACGSTVDDVFLPDELYNYLVDKDIGKEVRIAYENVSGRAYLIGFDVIR